MSEGRSEVSRARAVSWLGILWVYSGALWLLGLVSMLLHGWGGGAAAMAVRLAVTLAVGIGLCALERWAWAAAVCQAAVHLTVGVALALAAGERAVWAYGHALSWMPVFLGMAREDTARLAIAGALAALAGGATLRLLWRAQPDFGIPHRRPFTVLLRRGLAPGGAVVLADIYLAVGWWLMQDR